MMVFNTKLSIVYTINNVSCDFILFISSKFIPNLKIILGLLFQDELFIQIRYIIG